MGNVLLCKNYSDNIGPSNIKKDLLMTASGNLTSGESIIDPKYMQLLNNNSELSKYVDKIELSQFTTRPYLALEFYLNFNTTFRYTTTESSSIYLHFDIESSLPRFDAGRAFAEPESSGSDMIEHIFSYNGSVQETILAKARKISLYLEIEKLEVKNLSYTTHLYGIYPLT